MKDFDLRFGVSDSDSFRAEILARLFVGNLDCEDLEKLK